MRSIFTIYRLTLRSIFREKVALSMLALLALVLLLLPAGLETDGTIQGALRMHIRYSLGFSTFLLALMTLWVSCASIAGDLSSKRLQMLLTKPVRRASVWWGKWLAVVTLVSCLMLICGGVTWMRIQGIIRQAKLSPEAKAEVYARQVTARRPVDPLVEDLTPDAEKLADQQIAAGAVPEDFPREQVVAEMTRYLRVSRNAASAGESISYTFKLPKPLQAGQTFQIFYEYDGSAMGVGSVPGEWRIDLPDRNAVKTFQTLETPSGEKVIPVDVGEDLAGADVLSLTFENRSGESGRVFFKTEHGVRLFFQAGSFAPNLFRSLLLICGLLGILAAIGVSAGSVFSLPVACYVSAVVLMMQAFSGTVEEVVEVGMPPRGENQSMVSRTVQQFQFKVYQASLVVLKPMQMENPLGRVSRGVAVLPGEVLSIFGLRFIPVVLLISGLGILLFSRREIGGAV